MVRKEEFDAGVVWCRTQLHVLLGPTLGEEAFLSLPALVGLVAFKSGEVESIHQWARGWVAEA